PTREARLRTGSGDTRKRLGRVPTGAFERTDGGAGSPLEVEGEIEQASLFDPDPGPGGPDHAQRSLEGAQAVDRSQELPLEGERPGGWARLPPGALAVVGEQLVAVGDRRQ